MVFFEFWLRSHFLSLHPNFFILLELSLLFEIYPSMQIFLKDYLWIRRYEGVKGKNKTWAARKKSTFEAQCTLLDEKRTVSKVTKCILILGKIDITKGMYIL